MQTCLSGLWDTLMEHIIMIKHISSVDSHGKNELTVLEENRLAICHKIKIFCDGSVITQPKHIDVFYSMLSDSQQTLVQAASKASDCSIECPLCIGCIQCAKKFYDTILSEDNEERPLPGELLDYFAGNSQFYYYLSAYKSVKQYRRIRDTLICLKGFSSTTPAIYSAAFENACTGGGLYLNIGGYGVAVDPGIGFVNSMHKQGIFIEDINTVIVTHNHLDHNADLGTLSALLYDLNKYYERQVRFYKQFFDGVHDKKHTIDWFLDKSSKESMREIIGDSKELIIYDDWERISDNISMQSIETKHIKSGCSYGLKFRIDLEDEIFQIGYTSDAIFFPELAEFFADVNVLIFNISDIYEKDVRGTKSKGSHLGYDGSLRLLMKNFPNLQLAVASEFCCSNGDYRMKVLRKLSEQIERQKGVCVIPGEVGLKIDLPSGNICCSQCKRMVPISSVSVVAPEEEFGLIRYVCNRCQYVPTK